MGNSNELQNFNNLYQIDRVRDYPLEKELYMPDHQVKVIEKIHLEDAFNLTQYNFKTDLFQTLSKLYYKHICPFLIYQTNDAKLCSAAPSYILQYKFIKQQFPIEMQAQLKIQLYALLKYLQPYNVHVRLRKQNMACQLGILKYVLRFNDIRILSHEQNFLKKIDQFVDKEYKHELQNSIIVKSGMQSSVKMQSRQQQKERSTNPPTLQSDNKKTDTGEQQGYNKKGVNKNNKNYKYKNINQIIDRQSSKQRQNYTKHYPNQILNSNPTSPNNTTQYPKQVLKSNVPQPNNTKQIINYNVPTYKPNDTKYYPNQAQVHANIPPKYQVPNSNYFRVQNRQNQNKFIQFPKPTIPGARVVKQSTIQPTDGFSYSTIPVNNKNEVRYISPPIKKNNVQHQVNNRNFLNSPQRIHNHHNNYYPYQQQKPQTEVYFSGLPKISKYCQINEIPNKRLYSPYQQRQPLILKNRVRVNSQSRNYIPEHNTNYLENNKLQNIHNNNSSIPYIVIHTPSQQKQSRENSKSHIETQKSNTNRQTEITDNYRINRHFNQKVVQQINPSIQNSYNNKPNFNVPFQQSCYYFHQNEHSQNKINMQNKIFPDLPYQDKTSFNNPKQQTLATNIITNHARGSSFNIQNKAQDKSNVAINQEVYNFMDESRQNQKIRNQDVIKITSNEFQNKQQKPFAQHKRQKTPQFQKEQKKQNIYVDYFQNSKSIQQRKDKTMNQQLIQKCRSKSKKDSRQSFNLTKFSNQSEIYRDEKNFISPNAQTIIDQVKSNYFKQ